MILILVKMEKIKLDVVVEYFEIKKLNNPFNNNTKFIIIK